MLHYDEVVEDFEEYVRIFEISVDILGISFDPVEVLLAFPEKYDKLLEEYIDENYVPTYMGDGEVLYSLIKQY